MNEKEIALSNTTTIDKVTDLISQAYTKYDKEYVLKNAEREIIEIKNRKKDKIDEDITPDKFLYKSVTLFEFDKGLLLVSAVPERHRTLALEFFRNLQAEYNCQTPSEKSLAEVTALNFIRTLYIQEKISLYLAMDTMSEMGIKYLDVLSKDLDRAERHYLTSLQALRTVNSPMFAVNIKTNTAVIGQNQMVQVKNA